LTRLELTSSGDGREGEKKSGRGEKDRTSYDQRNEAKKGDSRHKGLGSEKWIFNLHG